MMKHLAPIPSAFMAAALASAVACSDAARVIDGPEGTAAGGASNEPGENASGSAGGPAGGAPQPGTPPPSTPPPSEARPDEAEPGTHPAGEAGAEAPAAVDGIPFITPRGPCELAARVGAFSVEKQVEFGVVQGSVAEGVVPTAIPRLALESGACQLLERRTLACIPACVGAETCGEDGACIPYPRQVSVGEVTITGLTKATAMSPLTPGNAYFSPGADNPPYAVASPIALVAAGDGEREGFQLFGIGSEPLAEAPTWQLEAGQDLSIEWSAPTSGVAATVLVELTIDQHGASPLSLSCELPDTGSASVPAVLVDRMIDSGVSGFPNGRLTRRTADHVELGTGCVELVVGSPLAARVSVSGFTPCNGSADCPSGQVCNVALQRCE